MYLKVGQQIAQAHIESPAAAKSPGSQNNTELNRTPHVNNTLQDLVQLTYWVTVIADKYNKVCLNASQIIAMQTLVIRTDYKD